ncbi:ABC-three component system middle component 2 [Actinomadura welshii]|uniref:ABC-three component system middle component 2 n=1 Tax=Actinomadura welshii TaxID=3103817 RepID=UPI001269751E|nr:ABC-three component system middle component 2 [Actinomadura madurae]
MIALLIDEHRDFLSPDFRPEDSTAFRLAQLLLMLDVLDENGWKVSIDRLGALDFFSANPFLVVEEDEKEFRQLVLGGFSSKPLTYASPGQRFETRRSRIRHDLSILLAYDLIRIKADHGNIVYTITEEGKETANRFNSLYAKSYRLSAEIVGRRIVRLSETKLRQQCRNWLRADPALLDLYNL